MRGHASVSAPAPVLPPRRVIVVGAGTAGLACAQELRAAAHLNLDVVVLEARNRVGGRILTHWFSADATSPSSAPAHASSHDALAASLTQRPNPAPDLQPSVSAHVSDVRDWPGPSRLNQDATPSAPALTQPATHHTALPYAARTFAGRPLWLPPRRHSFSDLVNGVVDAPRIASDGSPLDTVDIGASIMHGCGDDNQLVFKRAIHDKIRAPVVAGGGFYESTEHALWFDDGTGARIPTEKIVEVHNIFFMASRYMAAVASQSDDGAANMQAIFKCGVEYVCEQLGGRNLTPTELAILNKICARSVGYCSPMAVMALMQASAGMDSTCADTHVGACYEEDDPPFPGEVPSMSPSGIRQQAARLNKAIVNTQKPPKPMIASKKGGSGDRIVLDGYTPFLIDRLKEGIDVRLGQAVCGVSRAVKAPMINTLAPTDMHEEYDARGARPSRSSRKRTRIEEMPPPSWQSDPEVASRTILVSTRTGEVYQGDFVVITLPLGVLKEDHEESSVTFSPPLSEEKQEALRGMGMGVHNKVVLRFREEDVFWPPKVPQLNCVDPRFQFFNLHSYGKTGVLLVQVFAESGFANGYWDLTDEGVVVEVLMVLGGMFCAPPEKSDAATSEDGADSASKSAAARKRIARLLGICENCKRPVRGSSSADMGGKNVEHVSCMTCGLVVQRADESSPQRRVERSTKLRERTEREQGQSEAATAEGELDEIELAPGQHNFTWSKFPAPEEYIVTRWDQDPYALGSYSYMPCGSSWQMIDQMAAPEPRDSQNPYLFFAGEHCSDLGWQCVHGAYETGLRAARDIIGILSSGATEINNAETGLKDVPVPRTPATRTQPQNSTRDPFWTDEREKALTRALIGYSDVYGNLTDVIDEISHALQSFKKEPTDLTKEQVTELVHKRILDRVQEDDDEAKAFVNFHNGEKGSAQDEIFPKPFQEIHKRPRLVGLNGSKLRELYAGDIVQELRNYAHAVFENQISYRETLRKIALMIYKKDGGLMTKRCLSEYLRTQEFGTGPQKELFLEKYLPSK